MTVVVQQCCLLVVRGWSWWRVGGYGGVVSFKGGCGGCVMLVENFEF